VAGWFILVVGSVAVIAFFAAAVRAAIIGDWSSSDGTLVRDGFLFLLCPLYAWFCVIRPKIYVEGSTLVIVNPLGTQRIDLADIVYVVPGGWGLSILTRSRPTVVAFAVGKSNFAIWAGNEQTYADGVAAAIISMAPNAEDLRPLSGSARWSSAGEHEGPSISVSNWGARLPTSEETEVRAIADWFGELGFALHLTREREGLIWAELSRTPNGHIVVPKYGNGPTEVAAARRAKLRYEEEQ
jgi:hypothetical protein